MTNPPEIPKEIIESYKKLSEAKQKRLEFMAAYPEYLLDKNREDLLNGIDLIRKDFQKSTEQLAPSSRTAWKIAIVSLFGGFLLGVFAQDFKVVLFRTVETLSSAILPSKEAPKTLLPEHLSAEKAQTQKSE